MSTPSTRIAPSADVVEPADQVDQRALAGAAGADQADHLAGPDRQVDAVQHLAAAVAEARRRAARSRPAAGRDGPGRTGSGTLGTRSRISKMPLGAGGGALGGRDHPAHRLEPDVEPADVGQERRQHADGDAGRGRPARRRTPRRSAGRPGVSSVDRSGRRTTRCG